MADFEQTIQDAVNNQEIPGCVLTARNRNDTLNYNKTFGTRTVRPGGDQSPLQLDTVMWIASCTKLMTSICALQLVERGTLSLDQPIYDLIPELKDRTVITGFESDGKPIEKKHTKPITLRLLLTHTSGMCYDIIHPALTAWMKYYGKGPSVESKIIDRFNKPLVFEPGEAWSYGPSTDFVGLLIERATKVSLEDFMRENLWEPLGIKDMTFFLWKRPDLKARLAEMSERDEKTGKVVVMDGKQLYTTRYAGEVEDCMGGQGVFSSAEDYTKVLHALLKSDEDEKILKKETVELFFSPQLGPQASAMLNIILKDTSVNDAMGGVPQEVKKDWGLGGLLICENAPGGQKEGTMFWGGYPNLTWWLDRKSGLTGLYAGQLVPAGDKISAELTRKFQRSIYALRGHI